MGFWLLEEDMACGWDEKEAKDKLEKELLKDVCGGHEKEGVERSAVTILVLLRSTTYKPKKVEMTLD